MPRGSQHGLTPFVKGDGRAVAAGRKSAEARELKRAAERADIRALVGRLRTLAEHAENVNVSDTCIGVAVYVLGLVAAGQVPIRHGSDAAELVRVLVDVARLAGGQPTSTAAIVHLSAADARARLAELASLAGARPASLPVDQLEVADVAGVTELAEGGRRRELDDPVDQLDGDELAASPARTSGGDVDGPGTSAAATAADDSPAGGPGR